MSVMAKNSKMRFLSDKGGVISVIPETSSKSYYVPSRAGLIKEKAESAKTFVNTLAEKSEEIVPQLAGFFARAQSFHNGFTDDMEE